MMGWGEWQKLLTQPTPCGNIAVKRPRATTAIYNGEEVLDRVLNSVPESIGDDSEIATKPSRAPRHPAIRFPGTKAQTHLVVNVPSAHDRSDGYLYPWWIAGGETQAAQTEGIQDIITSVQGNELRPATPSYSRYVAVQSSFTNQS